jgi:hypothetical protein
LTDYPEEEKFNRYINDYDLRMKSNLLPIRDKVRSYL